MAFITRHYRIIQFRREHLSFQIKMDLGLEYYFSYHQKCLTYLLLVGLDYQKDHLLEQPEDFVLERRYQICSLILMFKVDFLVFFSQKLMILELHLARFVYRI